MVALRPSSPREEVYLTTVADPEVEQEGESIPKGSSVPDKRALPIVNKENIQSPQLGTSLEDIVPAC